MGKRLTLSDREWKPFYITDIFEIHATKSGFGKSGFNTGNEVAFVSQSCGDNGLCGTLSYNQPSKYKLENANQVTIGSDSQSVFYQPYDFYTGEKVHSVKHSRMNINIGFFVVSILRTQMDKFRWGHPACIRRLRKQRITLPVNETESPDWDFMDDYVSQVVGSAPKPQTPPASILCSQDVVAADWKPFEIGKLFDIHATKSGIDKNKIVSGYDVSYITRSDKRNGMTGIISINQNPKYCAEEENTITVGADTQTVFFQPYRFYTGEKVHSIRGERINKCVGLFLVTVIRIQLEKFGWNHIASLSRLRKQRIMLPTDSNGDVDYAFMEQYISDAMRTGRERYHGITL